MALQSRIYIPTKFKLLISLLLATIWCAFSSYLATGWINELSDFIGTTLAIVLVVGVALIPGFANAFLISGLLLDRRPSFDQDIEIEGISILIAAYNEEKSIRQTLESVYLQEFPEPIQLIIIDDGSSDNTVQIVNHYLAEQNNKNIQAQVLVQPQNAGKALALNRGLENVMYKYVVTLDADSYLYREALINLVKNIVLGPPNTAAVAGTVLTRNSRENWITQLQEWDYYHGIAVVKRIQSLFQGTLVAQGAFSIYETSALREIGGWPDKVGEDIVITWSMLSAGKRVSYAENAFAFTNVPNTYKTYYRQRKRWSRGVIEAFKKHPELIYTPRLNMPFIFFNLLFPYIDAAFIFGFIPGVILAVFFQNYAIVGIMTLFLLPLAMLMNYLMYKKQTSIFKRYGLKVRRNYTGLIGYVFFYQVLLAPASLMGYFYELTNLRKEW